MRTIVIAIICCLFATNALAEEEAGFQLSLVPDVAIHSKETRIKGFSLGIWGENPQNAFALGFVNGASGESTGLHLGIIANYSDNYRGVQLAHFANIAKGEFTGLQLSAFNYAAKLNGLQLGFVNYAKTADSGIQVGFVNILSSNEWFKNFPEELAPGMVFVNWKF